MAGYAPGEVVDGDRVLAAPAGAETRRDRAFYATTFERRPPFATMAALGRLVFMRSVAVGLGCQLVQRLPRSRRMRSGRRTQAVELAGSDRKASGVRAAPSLALHAVDAGSSPSISSTTTATTARTRDRPGA